jgi:amino acid transporter
MNIIAAISICFFLAGSCYFFINWVTFFRRQPNPSVEERFLAFTILIIATTFWVLLIPFYIFKLLVENLSKRSQAPEREVTSRTEPTIEYSEVMTREYKIKSQI